MAAAPEAVAGMIMPCEDPRLFGDATTNTVVLQYSYGGPQPGLSQSARQLAALMQLDLLFAQLKYRGIGVVFLSRTRKDYFCAPEHLLPQLLRQVRPGHGLVFLWGMFYEQGGVLYVQSFLELHRAGMSETIGLDWSAADGGTYHFAAGLPVTRLAFPPHQVIATDLVEIDRQYQMAAQAHTEARSESSSHPLIPDLDEPFGFVVERVAGDWMELKSLANKPLGWVNAGSIDREWPLRHKLPELDFVDASVAYLQARIAASSKGSRTGEPRLQRHLTSAVERFAAATDRDRGNAAMAQANAMVGMAAVAGTGWRAAFPDAHRAFAAAAMLLPSSAEARNLKVLADIEACCISNRGEPPAQAVIEALGQAVQLDPTDDQVLANLESFYGALRSYRAKQLALGVTELEARRRDVAAARAAIKTQP